MALLYGRDDIIRERRSIASTQAPGRFGERDVDDGDMGEVCRVKTFELGVITQKIPITG